MTYLFLLELLFYPVSFPSNKLIVGQTAHQDHEGEVKKVIPQGPTEVNDRVEKWGKLRERW